MIEARGLFLLDDLLQNADVFGIQNLDRERLVRQVTVNETVEAEELRGVRLGRHFMIKK